MTLAGGCSALQQCSPFAKQERARSLAVRQLRCACVQQLGDGSTPSSIDLVLSCPAYMRCCPAQRRVRLPQPVPLLVRQPQSL